MNHLVTRRLCVALALAVLAAPALGACSSASGGTGRSGSSADSGAKSPAPAKSGTSGAGTTTGAGASSGSTDLAGFCSLIGRNNRILTEIAAGDQRQSGVDTHKLIADLNSLVAAAPAEIKPDLQVIVDFDTSLFQHPHAIKESPQLAQAMQHYAAWIGKNCAGKSALPAGTS
ncbi:MAG: hypothetical protein M3042_11760 [Actinomycetota bacterium]|nr:hypothetical protein [Actinomycetota bacterium]